MNVTFENFKKIFFDGLEPDEYGDQITKLKEYLDEICHDFRMEYVYCSGCRKFVKKNESYAEQSTPYHVLIKCNKCNTVWYVRDKCNARLVEWM